MKILHLNTENTWRGGERQTLLLAAELQRCGLDNAIACVPGEPLWTEARRQGVPVISLSRHLVQAVVRLARRARDFDLLHCHTGRTLALASLTASLHGRTILVTRRVDFFPPRHWLYRRIYHGATRVVCISRHIETLLRDWGVAAEKLEVILDAVPLPNPSVGRVARERFCQQFGIPSGKRLVGNIAAMVGLKDQAALLRAARHVADRRKDVLFVVMGDGPLRNRLRQLRRDLGLEQTVWFLGFVPQAQQYLPAFDVLAMSSRMEGLGSIILDAFAAGVPVAATAAGGIPELVREGRTGMLVPVGDATALGEAVVRLFEEPERVASMAAVARDWVATECTVEHMGARYIAVYRRVLG